MGCCASICKKDDIYYNNSNNKPIRYSVNNNSNSVNNNSNSVNKPSSEKLPKYSTTNNSNNVNKSSSEKLPVYGVFLHDSYSSRTRDKSYEIVERSTECYYVGMMFPKHRAFVREPMRDKDIRQITGIGEKYGSILESKGFCKAYHLLGQYLLLSRDRTVFEAWLEAEVGMNNSKWRGDCSLCLEGWCEANL